MDRIVKGNKSQAFQNFNRKKFKTDVCKRKVKRRGIPQDIINSVKCEERFIQLISNKNDKLYTKKNSI